MYYGLGQGSFWVPCKLYCSFDSALTLFAVQTMPTCIIDLLSLERLSVGNIFLYFAQIMYPIFD
jgi:hypothetical protein